MVFMSVKCPQSLVTQTWGDRGPGVSVRVSGPYYSTDGCRKPQWFMNATVYVSPLETDGFCDKVCDSHLQSVRATESGHCSEWAAMASSAGKHRAHSTPTGYTLTSSHKNVSGTLLTKGREVWSYKLRGLGITHQRKYVSVRITDHQIVGYDWKFSQDWFITLI